MTGNEKESRMGVYPCKHCGALFVSVTMTQEEHALGCPYSERGRSAEASCAVPGCGHSWAAHCGHTVAVGQPEPHHCSQLCGCRAFMPVVRS